MEKDPIKPSVTRKIELDVLRGIAILLVLGRHILDIPSTLPPFIGDVFLIWREVGWIGVDLFFTLSGFLVSRLLFIEYQQAGKLHLGLFLIRRGFKICPSFYFFLLISIFTAFCFSFPFPFSERAFLGEGLFLQNYVGSYWNHTWSLAVEEHFYIVLAGIMLVLVNTRPKARDPFEFTPKLILTIAIAILFLRVGLSRSQPFGSWHLYLPFTHFRIDSLFFGVLISYLYIFKTEILYEWISRWRWLCLIAVCQAFFLPIIFPLDQGKFIYSFGFSFLYVGFGCLLLLCLHPTGKGKFRSIFKSACLAYIGRNSYAIYLWHMFCYESASRVWIPLDTSPDSFFLRTSVYLTSSLIIGILATKAIEAPMLRLRDRLFPPARY